jgi:hypothetical protein
MFRDMRIGMGRWRTAGLLSLVGDEAAGLVVLGVESSVRSDKGRRADALFAFFEED